MKIKTFCRDKYYIAEGELDSQLTRLFILLTFTQFLNQKTGIEGFHLKEFKKDFLKIKLEYFLNTFKF